MTDEDGKYAAFAYDINWRTFGWYHDPHMYIDFVFQIRLERYDNVRKTIYCDYTWYVNHHNFTKFDDPTTCKPSGWYSSSARGGWTADGRLIYDFNKDGEGNYSWHFHGTPSIY